MAGILLSDNPYRIKVKKIVISSLLSAFVLIMSLSRPWEHRIEIMGSILIPKLERNIVLQKPEVFKTFIQKKNAAKVAISINKKIYDRVTLNELGFKITSPEIEKLSQQPSFLEEILTTFITQKKEPEPWHAELSLDHTTLQSYIEKIKKEVEIEAKKPSIMWSDDKKWHFEPIQKGIVVDEVDFQKTLPSLVTALQNGSENLVLKLKTKKIKPEISSAERTRIHRQLDAVKALIKTPVTLMINKTAKVLDLNSAPDYIVLFGEGAELNDEKVEEWIESIGQEFYKQPGMIRIKEKKEIRKGVFKAETEGDMTFGEGIKEEEILPKIKEILATEKRIVDIPIEKIPFNVYSDLEQSPYDLLSVGWSEYSTGNHKERVHNFTTALKRISGTLIDRGQEISFNKSLGNLDSEFVKGLGILGPAALPVLGGGLCQASTTFYRALLNLGVPIKMRKNHSWDLSYYRKGGYGLDATVFPEQGLDVKGVNDYDSQLYLYAYTLPETTEAFVLVYGKSDGRKVAMKPEQDYKFFQGPKTLKWDHIVYMPTGETREHEIVSTYTK